MVNQQWPSTNINKERRFPLLPTHGLLGLPQYAVRAEKLREPDRHEWQGGKKETADATAWGRPTLCVASEPFSFLVVECAHFFFKLSLGGFSVDPWAAKHAAKRL
jgi:hypothetical protein